MSCLFYYDEHRLALANFEFSRAYRLERWRQQREAEMADNRALTAPLCSHGLPGVSRVSSHAGPNFGRVFFICPLEDKKARCALCQWERREKTEKKSSEEKKAPQTEKTQEMKKEIDHSSLDDQLSQQFQVSLNFPGEPKKEEFPIKETTVAAKKENSLNPFINLNISSLDALLEKQQRILNSHRLVANLPDGGERILQQIALIKEARKSKTEENTTTIATTAAPTVVGKSLEPVKTLFLPLADAAALTASVPERKSSKNSASSENSKTAANAPAEEEKIKSMINSLSTAITSIHALPTAVSVTGLLRPLFPHQAAALHWLQQREIQQNTEFRSPDNKMMKINIPTGGLLCDDCGLGKTLELLAFVAWRAQALRMAQAAAPKEASFYKDYSPATLIVCPKALVSQWNHQISLHFSPDCLRVSTYYERSKGLSPIELAQYDIIITSFGTVRGEWKSEGDEKIETKTGLFGVRWQRIIADEAHNLRNSRSQQSRAIVALTARHRWFVTATPIQNSLDDLFAAFSFLKFEPFDRLAFFKSACGEIESIRKLLAVLMLRRMKSDGAPTGESLLALPPKTVKHYNIEFSAAERSLYSALREEFRRDLKRAGPAGILVRLLRLRQCCDHPALIANTDDNDDEEEEGKKVGPERAAIAKAFSVSGFEKFCKPTEAAPADEVDALSAQLANVAVSRPSFASFNSAKCARLLELLEELPASDKILVFSQFTRMLDIIQEKLTDRGISFARLDGSMSGAAQQAAVKDFQSSSDSLEDSSSSSSFSSSARVFLLSLKSASCGLNLTQANHCVLFDSWWNPAIELQAQERIHRPGQVKAVFVHKFLIKDSVEDFLHQLQARKEKIAHEALKSKNPKPPTGGGKKKTPKFSTEEMESLI